jgi:hypothetical protein
MNMQMFEWRKEIIIAVKNLTEIYENPLVLEGNKKLEYVPEHNGVGEIRFHWCGPHQVAWCDHFWMSEWGVKSYSETRPELENEEVIREIQDLVETLSRKYAMSDFVAKRENSIARLKKISRALE